FVLETQGIGGRRTARIRLNTSDERPAAFHRIGVVHVGTAGAFTGVRRTTAFYARPVAAWRGLVDARFGLFVRRFVVVVPEAAAGKPRATGGRWGLGSAASARARRQRKGLVFARCAARRVLPTAARFGAR